MNGHQQLGAQAACFATTQWNVVLQAKEPDNTQFAQSLDTLCRTYYYPLYAYVRRRGYSAHDAEDLTQEFFAQLLARPFLANVTPEKGLFRSFLLASMNYFLVNEWDRARALKRGGKVSFISIQDETAESRYVREIVPAVQVDAEREFDRRWAVVLLEAAMARLEAEISAAGKTVLFEKLRGFLEADPMPGEYARLASELGWTKGAVAVAVRRLRVRFRKLVAEEVVRTVLEPEEAEAELQRLMAALQEVAL